MRTPRINNIVTNGIKKNPTDYLLELSFLPNVISARSIKFFANKKDNTHEAPIVTEVRNWAKKHGFTVSEKKYGKEKTGGIIKGGQIVQVPYQMYEYTVK